MRRHERYAIGHFKGQMSHSYGMPRWRNRPRTDFFQREAMVFRANSEKCITSCVLSEPQVEHARVKPDRAIEVSHFEDARGRGGCWAIFP
jgi:hypothetical protein